MISRRRACLTLTGAGLLNLAGTQGARASSASELTASARKALASLYTLEPRAQALGKTSRAILVFPQIVKAGFLIGAETGDGAFFENDRATAFYNITAASYGLQAGVQSFSYALFFMNRAAVNYLTASRGWTVGTGPNIVVLDKGKAESVTSTSLTEDVYAVPFGARGLMAGIGLEGSKITPIEPGS